MKDVDSWKSHLRLAMARCRLVSSKLLHASRNCRLAIADLLSSQRTESARIKTRLLIRDDYLIEAVEELEGYLDDLLHGRGVIEVLVKTKKFTTETSKDDCGIIQAIQSVIYAEPRVEVPELARVVKDLAGMFGKEFVARAVHNADQLIDPRFILKLTMQSPDEQIVDRYLLTIGQSYGINTKSVKESNNATTSLAPPTYEQSNFEEIAKRFEALKKR